MKPPKSFLVLTAVILLLGPPSYGATFNIADGDVAALINAINTANSAPDADTINLATRGTYILTTVNHVDQSGANNGLPLITSDLTINGNGAQITRSAAAGTPELRLIAMRGGDTPATRITAALHDLYLTNAANSGGYGGAVQSIGTVLSIDRCTFASNAAGSGAGLRNFDGYASVKNSTFVANAGGAIFNDSDGRAEIHNCTFYLNSYDLVNSAVFGSFAEMNVGGCILTASVSGNRSITSDGFNISTGSAGSTFTAPTDRPNTSPRFDAMGLNYNGGLTPTLALASDSPAIDTGSSFGFTTDQRGYARRHDLVTHPNGASSDASDVGAYEAYDFRQAGATLVVTTTDDRSDEMCGVTDCTLREALDAANTVAGDNTLTFAPGVAGTITLAAPLPTINTNVSIVGPGARILALSGNNAHRVLHFTAGTSALSGLTVRNGRVAGASGATAIGAGILNSGTLTVTECTIRANQVQGGAGSLVGSAGGDGHGAGFANHGVATISRSLFAANSASGGNGAAGSSFTSGGRGGSANGAAIYNPANATLTIDSCTVAENSAAGGNGGNFGNPRGGSAGNAHGGVWNNGALIMTACTVSANSGTAGTPGSGSSNGNPGIATGGFQNTGTFTVRSSISVGNTGGDVRGSFSSEGFNLIGPLNGATGFNATSDQTGTSNAQLGALQNNGGPTNTMALAISSPALDRGNSFGLPHDQRGHLRRADSTGFANAPSGDGADIGACEFHPLSGLDSDGDGLPQDFETFYGVSNPADDSDGDGLSDGQEFTAGTNPRDAASGLRITSVQRTGALFRVTFQLAVAGKSYRLERKDSPGDPTWNAIPGLPDYSPNASGAAELSDSGISGRTRQIYRVRVLP